MPDKTGSSKRKTFGKNPDYTIRIGSKLKSKRLESGYSLKNMSFMTEITVKTCIDIEKGDASGIDYYLEYAKALAYPLPELFEIEIVYKPRHELPKADLTQVSLAKKIMHLKNEKSLFKTETYVHEIRTLLLEEKLVEDSDILSADISGVLLNWCSKEEGFLKKRKVEGNNNVYWLVAEENF